jgi:hypothetical protein
MGVELATHPLIDGPADIFSESLLENFDLPSRTVPSQVPAAAVVHHGCGVSWTSGEETLTYYYQPSERTTSLA